MVSFQTRLCYFNHKADLKARKECHLFEKYYLCKKMCDRCSAIQPRGPGDVDNPLNYKNMSRDAPYKRHTVPHQEYLRTARRLSPWCAIRGFQIESCSWDVLHLIFLGVARNHVPSCLKILHTLGYHYEVGESASQFLKRTSMEMKADCKAERKHASKSVAFMYCRCPFPNQPTIPDKVSFMMCNGLEHMKGSMSRRGRSLWQTRRLRMTTVNSTAVSKRATSNKCVGG